MFSNFEWGLNNRVAGSWTTWFLDFNKRGARNKRGGTKFGPFLINVAPEITKLWVENSQKINCRGATSIWEGRVHKKFIFAYIRIMKLLKKKYFEKFIEELDFVELSTQTKHLRVWILHDDGLNENQRY